jgi:hypothetical protein
VSVGAWNPSELSTTWLEALHRRRMALLWALVMLVSLVMVRLILAVDVFAVAGLFVWICVGATVVRPRYGLYAVFGIVLLFEGSSDDPLMAPGVYLNNSLQNTLGASGGILIPLEILMLLILVAWLGQGLMRHGLDFRGGTLGRPMLLYGLALVFGVVHGLMTGAVFNFAFWESRFLFYTVLCYVLAANLIRTRAHVDTLLSLVMVCVTASGIEGAWRKSALIDAGLLGPAQEMWYSHESVVIWGLLVILVFAQLAFGGPRWQRILGPFAVAIAGYTMLVSERRAGYIAVMVALMALAFVLLVVKRKAFVMIALPLLIVTAVYLPVFWNDTGVMGQPARAVRSISDPDPRDAASNLSRDLEAINVRATIASSPLLGIGFGRPFLQIVTIPDISFFPFWNYEAHHGILWVWMKVGAIGFVLFFVVMGRGIASSARLTHTLRDRNARVLALLTLGSVVMSLVFCYVDLGLTTSRIPVVLGTLLGTVSVLDRIYANDSAPRTS